MGANISHGRTNRHLTRRERQVLDLVLKFKLNKQIADELCIGLRTVKMHVSNIFLKFGVQDRTELFALHYPNGPVSYGV